MWEKVGTNGRSMSKVTIRKKVIAFSSYFIKNESLVGMKYVDILLDQTLKRIGFVFSDIPTNASLHLKQDGGKINNRTTNGRIVYIDLSTTEWIQRAIESKGNGKTISLKLNKENFDSNTLFCCELENSYTGLAGIDTIIDVTNNISGVYRLFNSKKQVVRIGESKDIKKRINDHIIQYPEEHLAFFDYLNIRDTNERKKEEKRLLNQFKTRHNGFLPELNSITA